MVEVGVHEAKSQLSKLLRRVASGEEVVILRSGRPVARLVPPDAPAVRRFGLDRGLYTVPDDFDETPEEVLASFEAADEDSAGHARLSLAPDDA